MLPRLIFALPMFSRHIFQLWITFFGMKVVKALAALVQRILACCYRRLVDNLLVLEAFRSGRPCPKKQLRYCLDLSKIIHFMMQIKERLT